MIKKISNSPIVQKVHSEATNIIKELQKMQKTMAPKISDAFKFRTPKISDVFYFGHAVVQK